MVLKKKEVYLKEVLTGKRKGLLAAIIKAVTLPLSFVFKSASKLRNKLYDMSLMRCYTPPVPLVISVGNIVAGGTGKTPLICCLIEKFLPKYKIAVISRGYRSPAEKKKHPTIVCSGDGPICTVDECGDEPFMYAKKHPSVMVIVGKNRKESCKLASELGAEVILLDDAMQYRKLKRDIDVVIMDTTDLFGLSHFLPRGFLRESPSNLKRADLIFLNHVQSTKQFELAKDIVSNYSKADVIAVDYRLESAQPLINDKKLDDFILNGCQVALFSTIANPHHFKKLLESHGAEVVLEKKMADHDKIKDKDLKNFAVQAEKKGATILVCTEKDGVKVSDSQETKLPIFVIRARLELVAGKESFESFISAAFEKLEHLT